jgi:hypothetical protein
MDSAFWGLSTNVFFIQIEMLGFWIIMIRFGVEWVVNRVFTTRTKNLFLPFRFRESKQRSRAARIVEDFEMSSSTKFGHVVKNYASTSTERGVGGE